MLSAVRRLTKTRTRRPRKYIQTLWTFVLLGGPEAHELARGATFRTPSCCVVVAPVGIAKGLVTPEAANHRAAVVGYGHDIFVVAIDAGGIHF